MKLKNTKNDETKKYVNRNEMKILKKWKKNKISEKMKI